MRECHLRTRPRRYLLPRLPPLNGIRREPSDVNGPPDRKLTEMPGGAITGGTGGNWVPISGGIPPPNGG